MKNALKTIAAVAAISVSGLASAAGYSLGTITYLHTMANGALLVQSSATSTGQPACSSPSPSRYVINTTTDAGRNMASLMLWAAALGKTVAFNGLGTCSLWTDSEDVLYLTVPNN